MLMAHEQTAQFIPETSRLAALLSSGGDGEIPEDRARGLILGLAVGNLLGLPVEGWSQEEISRHRPGGRRDIDPRERHRAMDDDLAQAVDLAEALVSDVDPLDDFALRLIRWRRENGRGIGIMTSTVIDYLEDGLGVPGAGVRFWEERGRPSTQPNGALMRTAPVALRYAHDAEGLIRGSASTSAVTHVAPGAIWSCILVNAAIAMLLRGEQPDISELSAAAVEDGAPAELGEWIGQIPDAIEQRIAGEPVIGHTYLCMQAALWCVSTTDDLRRALERIVAAGGDTDTNGAVAGAVLGARYGVSAIPAEWLDCVPQRDRIETVVTALRDRSAPSTR